MSAWEYDYSYHFNIIEPNGSNTVGSIDIKKIIKLLGIVFIIGNLI